MRTIFKCIDQVLILSENNTFTVHLFQNKMDPKCSWMIKKYQKKPEDILKGRDQEILYVNVLLTRQMPGKQYAALVVKVPKAPVADTTNLPPRPRRRVVEKEDDWHLPGTECLPTDENILRRLTDEIYATLGLTITKFKKKVFEEVITVNDENLESRDVLVMTFRAKHTDAAIVVGGNRYEETRWVTEDDLNPRTFRMGKEILKKVKKKLHRLNLALSIVVPGINP
ncbi:hypothetical protein RRF57_007128 [Xylaria bambusicola]|uniref:Uncharacterized protein n=1 Tax=Xylaria bambusicola TaxID=326684 RepID=A0AAN7V068_9PEZI